MRRRNSVTGGAAALAVAALMSGCATAQTPTRPDSVEAVLAAPQNLVRSAVVRVLTDAGYEVGEEDQPDRVLSKDYRQEIDSPWDSLLASPFGVSRSRVQVSIIPENDTTTRLLIQVNFESNGGLFASWRPYETPLPQSAANQLRLIRNMLGLL